MNEPIFGAVTLNECLNKFCVPFVSARFQASQGKLRKIAIFQTGTSNRHWQTKVFSISQNRLPVLHKFPLEYELLLHDTCPKGRFFTLQQSRWMRQSYVTCKQTMLILNHDFCMTRKIQRHVSKNSERQTDTFWA